MLATFRGIVLFPTALLLCTLTYNQLGSGDVFAASRRARMAANETDPRDATILRLSEEVSVLKNGILQLEKDMEKGNAAQLERAINYFEKMDAKLGNAALIMAVAAASIPAIAVFFGIFEFFVQRRRQRFEQAIAEIKSASEKEFEKVERSLARGQEAFEISAVARLEHKVAERLDYTLTKDLKILAARVENAYARNLSKIETILSSFLQNECSPTSSLLKSNRGDSLYHTMTIRQLLIQLVAGDGKEILTASGRLIREYVGWFGYNTSCLFDALLGDLAKDSRYMQRDIAEVLELLRDECKKRIEDTA
jgi:VIT1/CCC1 family predicted Fe2+/Mn2+ transporter